MSDFGLTLVFFCLPLRSDNGGLWNVKRRSEEVVGECF